MMSVPHAPIAVVLIPKGPERPLHYAIPSDLRDSLQLGMRLEVPLGRRRTTGYLIDWTEQAQAKTLKEIIRPLESEPSLLPSLLVTARWMAGYYRSPLARAIRVMTPPGVEEVHPKRRLHVRLLRSMESLERDLPELSRRGRHAAALIETLVALGGEAPLSDLPRGSRAAVGGLVKKGWLQRFEHESYRDPFPEWRGTHPPSPPKLSTHQAEAFSRICDGFEKGRFSPFLLHGVTGSGKTEVYLHAVEEVLRRGKGAIILVPEIGLTSQALSRFRDRFGRRVVLFHSALSAGERLDAWRRARDGTSQVAVGTRSAIFAPISPLGLIVVDEEQDASYKQEEGLRYHARDVALVRAQQEGAVALLGSATPSLESYQNSLRGKYTCLSLPERIDGRPLPRVEVVPLSERGMRKGESGRGDGCVGDRSSTGWIEGEAASRATKSHTDIEGDVPHSTLLSSQMLGAIAARLERKEQTLLFLNRRGFAPFILCRECGEVPHCPHCAIAFTLHRKRRQLLCHYCGHAVLPPVQCGRCGGSRIEEMGAGTERLEGELQRLFPHARVLRMDRDTTQKKHAHHRILESVARGEVDILIGTQMVAKGHDLPQVTLVGILCADLGLQLPDFRAAERTFQVLVQVAGRAGRGMQPGEVLVQTYHPDHYTIRYARAHDVAGFYREELAQRQQGPYPPFCRLIVLRVRGRSEEGVIQHAREIAGRLGKKADAVAGIQVLGPSPCPIERLRGQWRWQILLRGPSHRAMAQLLAAVLPTFPPSSGSIRLDIDVDPLQML